MGHPVPTRSIWKEWDTLLLEVQRLRYFHFVITHVHLIKLSRQQIGTKKALPRGVVDINVLES